MCRAKNELLCAQTAIQPNAESFATDDPIGIIIGGGDEMGRYKADS